MATTRRNDHNEAEAPQKKYATMPRATKPPAAGIAALAKVRREVNPTILRKRLKSFGPAELKLFETLSKVGSRRVRAIRGGTGKDAQVAWTIETWGKMCADPNGTCFTVTYEELAERFEAHFGFRRDPSTLKRYVPNGKFLKPRGTYVKPNNDPSFHYKLLALGKR